MQLCSLVARFSSEHDIMEKVKFKLKISKLGHEKKANQILTKTIEIVKDIKELNKKDYCLFQVSQLYATFRKWRKARKEIDLTRIIHKYC